MSWEEKEILLVVKTYPVRSKKYGNTVCTAGILEDSNEWVRIYPVNFNSYRVKSLKKFTKFTAQIRKNTKEISKRKESYNIRESTIKITNKELIDPNVKGVWEERRIMLDKLLSNSMEFLEAQGKLDRTSLGIIKPKLSSVEFKFKKPIEDIEIDIANEIQLNLYGQKLKQIDKIENIFFYHFECNTEECPGHNMICTDWELLQSFRKWRKKYTNPRDLEEKLKQKYEKWMKSRDLHFILGTHNIFRTWFIIGLFYPPKRKDRTLNNYFK